jgi:hypothetical protein
MPRKLESGGTYSYVLKTDRDKQPPPTFKLRILSGREDDKLRDIVNDFKEAIDNQSRSSLVREALGIAIVGWENMGELAFSLDEAENLLTRRECWELISEVTLEASLTAEERKKSELQHSSETG